MQAAVERLHNENIERPTALLGVLGVIGSTEGLAHHLFASPRLMPALLRCLSHSGATLAVGAAVVALIDVLLDMRMQDERINAGLVQCMHEILDRLSDHVALKAKPKRSSAEEKHLTLVLRVISRLGCFDGSAEQSRKLVNLLMSFLAKGHRVTDDLLEALLTIVSDRSSALADINEHVPVIAELLQYRQAPRLRQAVAACFVSLGRASSSLEGVGLVLEQLNATDSSKVGDLDYETRLAAYSVLNGGAFKKYSGIAFLPVLYHCLFDLTSDDLSLRSNAVFLLKNFTIHAGTQCTAADVLCWAAWRPMPLVERLSQSQHLVLHVVMPALKRNLRSDTVQNRTEAVGLIAVVVAAFKEQFPHLALLIDMDQEVDWFNNIVHLQLHRRVRALKKVATLVSAHADFSVPDILHILIPLIWPMAFPSSEAKKGQENVLDEAVRTLSSLAARLPWRQYYSVLQRGLRLLPTPERAQKIEKRGGFKNSMHGESEMEASMEKSVVRVLCAVLEQFHFDLSSVEPYDPQRPPARGSRVENDADDADADAGDEPVAVEDTRNSPEVIRDVVLGRVVPLLYKFITQKNSGEDEHLHMPLSAAVLSVLKALPQDQMETELPRLVGITVFALRSRFSDVRDSTRKTVSTMMASLGPKYFSFVLSSMKTHLTRGYQLHVLGYSLFDLLEKLVPGQPDGVLDHAIESIMEVVINELTGGVAEEKEVTAVASKMRECKVKRGYDIVELLARVSSLGAMGDVIAPLRQVAAGSRQLKIRRTVEEALRKVGTGLLSRESLDVKEILVTCHHNIKSSLQKKTTEEQTEQLIGSTGRRGTNGMVEGKIAFKREDSLLLAPPIVRGVQHNAVYDSHSTHNEPLFLAHELQVIRLLIKKHKLNMGQQSSLELIDPFVGLLLPCLKNKDDKVLMCAVKIFATFSRSALPTLKPCMKQIVDRLFKVVRKGGVTNGPVVQAAFQALCGILRECSYFKFSDAQLEVMLSMCAADIEESEKQPTTFALLKAIVSRKLVCAQMYEVMKRVASIMVQSHVQSARTLSSQLLLMFLLDYPLGPKRLQQVLVSRPLPAVLPFA
jgi:U3 small nucleolar RNA-associated protein 20